MLTIDFNVETSAVISMAVSLSSLAIICLLISLLFAFNSYAPVLRVIVFQASPLEYLNTLFVPSMIFGLELYVSMDSKAASNCLAGSKIIELKQVVKLEELPVKIKLVDIILN